LSVGHVVAGRTENECQDMTFASKRTLLTGARSLEEKGLGKTHSKNKAGLCRKQEKSQLKLENNLGVKGRVKWDSREEG